MVGASKSFKLSTDNFFGVSFQKKLLSSFLLFYSVCYKDDLRDSGRKEIASSTTCNFSNS